MSSRWLWLVELTGYTAAATSDVYRYATEGYTTAPGDTPASTHYAGRVKSIDAIERTLFAAGESGARANPRSEVGVGRIVLHNLDGELDDLFGDGTVSFRERQCRILRVRQGAAYSTAQLVLRCSISQAALQQSTVSISLKDRLYELASAHTTTTFAGNNALPAGVEGSTELAGKVKPQVWGKVLSIAPPLVNSSRLIYQLSTRALQSVQAIYDGGVALTAGATYASQADMEATAPSAGQYRAWLSGGMIRLGSSPVYGITADCTADSAANSTAAQLIKALALARGIDAGDISSADVSALDTANSAVLGYYLDDSTTTLDIMDACARSVGAWYGFDRSGVLRMARVAMPSGTVGVGALPVVARWNTQSLESVPSGEDVPTGTVRAKYARYWRTQSQGDLSTSATAAQVSDLGQAYRIAEATATISPNPHKRTLVAERETILTASADASTEATRLAAFSDAPRRTHRASGVSMADPDLDGLDIGDEVELRWDRFGMGDSTGTARLVIGITEDVIAQRADLLLWGP